MGRAAKTRNGPVFHKSRVDRAVSADSVDRIGSNRTVRVDSVRGIEAYRTGIVDSAEGMEPNRTGRADSAGEWRLAGLFEPIRWTDGREALRASS